MSDLPKFPDRNPDQPDEDDEDWFPDSDEGENLSEDKPVEGPPLSLPSIAEERQTAVFTELVDFLVKNRGDVGVIGPLLRRVDLENMTGFAFSEEEFSLVRSAVASAVQTLIAAILPSIARDIKVNL